MEREKFYCSDTKSLDKEVYTRSLSEGVLVNLTMKFNVKDSRCGSDTVETMTGLLSTSPFKH